MNCLKSLTNCLPSWYMDFEGQRRAECTFQIILAVFGLAGFAWGYVCQQFSQAVYILAAGFVLSALLTLPPWPMYRRNPLKWQPAPSAGASGAATAATGGASKSSGQGDGAISGRKAAKKEK